MRPFSRCLSLLLLLSTCSSNLAFPRGNQDPKTFQVQPTQDMEKARANKDINNVGSSPPSCERKCYGCRPCQATQVPTTAAHLRVQYTNYEPEGWMCKCGHTFFSP